jgi:cell division protein FtsB
VDWIKLSLTQRRLTHRLEALSARRQQLRDEQRRLESDDAYVEGLFRSTFKLARPGEYVIDIQEP